MSMRTMPGLSITPEVFEIVWGHLLPSPHRLEEAAFLFCDYQGDGTTLRVVGFELMAPDDYAVQLPYHFELTREALARVIKMAHDRGAMLVEVHSHLGSGSAFFSRSDLTGFVEVVPHVRWRLKGRPYGAVVTATDGFSGLLWSGSDPRPTPIRTIQVGEALLSSQSVGVSND